MVGTHAGPGKTLLTATLTVSACARDRPDPTPQSACLPAGPLLVLLTFHARPSCHGRRLHDTQAKAHDSCAQAQLRDRVQRICACRSSTRTRRSAVACSGSSRAQRPAPRRGACAWHRRGGGCRPSMGAAACAACSTASHEDTQRSSACCAPAQRVSLTYALLDSCCVSLSVCVCVCVCMRVVGTTRNCASRWSFWASASRTPPRRHLPLPSNITCSGREPVRLAPQLRRQRQHWYARHQCPLHTPAPGAAGVEALWQVTVTPT